MSSESSDTDQPIQAADKQRDPAEVDCFNEKGVLDALVHYYPELFTEEELIRELVHGQDDWRGRDGLERAITCLAASGLVNRCGPLVVPSRAARRSQALKW